MNGMRPIHPGEILRERRGVTTDTALRLSCYFGTTAQFWINLQSAHDLKSAELQVGKQLRAQIQPHNAA